MASDLLELCRDLPVVAFQPGEPLLEEGRTSGRLYVLIDGAVEVAKGDFQINVVNEPGAILGDMSVLLGMPHMATVRAVSPARAYVSERGAEFLQSNAEIAFQLSRMLAQRLQGVTSYLVDLKRQFEDHDSHLGMVDEVLESLVHQPTREFTPGSDRTP